MLLGGGFALADATKKSGLSQFLVNQLDGLKVIIVQVFEESFFYWHLVFFFRAFHHCG
jgi:di/tricarboxylate transporter